MRFLKTYIVEIIFSVIYLFLALLLNLQFLQGSNINDVITGHDEYIAVREVYSILHPISWKHFFLSVIAGDIIFYGRIMFYTDALFAFIPYKLFGITGMVYTIRMLHAVCLIMGLNILANTFLKDNMQKALFLIGSGAMFYSLYFVMMPKPEPMQLLVLSLFLFYFKKTNWSFGPHFILLGTAFGLKFNALLILPFAFLIPLIKNKQNQVSKIITSGLKAFVFFLAGLFIAIPCLLLSPLKPIYLTTYIHETFMGTGKTYDNLSLSIFDWLKQGFGSYYLGHFILGYLFIALVIIAVFYQWRKIRYNHDISALLLLLMGLLMNTMVMITTKRLWPHYLWTGFIFMLLGLIVFAAQQTSLKNRRIYFSSISFFMIISLFSFLTRDLPIFLNLESRHTIQEDIKSDQLAINYIRQTFPGSQVATDASLLFPFEDFVIANPYHPFSSALPETNETRFMWYGDHPENIWEEKNDFVMFHKRHPLHPSNGTPQNFRTNEFISLYKEKTQSEFYKDTSFGEVIIYRRNSK
jgi:hypothetical protein